jgi:hypothetical protein
MRHNPSRELRYRQIIEILGDNSDLRILDFGAGDGQLVLKLLNLGFKVTGWEQSQIFNLNVGWDENFEIDGSPAVNPNLAYKIRDLWRNSSVRGTPMMRPIVGKWLTPPVGSEEIEAKTQIQKGTLQVVIYPNPASTILRIDAPGKNGKLDIRILDLQGRIVLHQSNLENEVHLPLLTNGMYLIQVTDESGNSSTEKLIIQQ